METRGRATILEQHPNMGREDMTETLAWALERIRKTPLSMEPYPHLVVDSFLPWEFWQRLGMRWPAEDACHTSAPSVRQWDLVADPGVKRCADGRWRIGGSYYAEEWSDFRRVFMGYSRPTPPPLISALLTKFAAQVEDMVDIETDAFYTVGRCAYDYQGAGLGPHIDRVDKVFSCILSFARGDETDEERVAMGTQLLKPKRDMSEYGEQHLTHADFEVAKVAEYVPNRLTCWAVTPDSFHSYHQTVEGPRRTIKFFVQKVMDMDVVHGRIADTKGNAEDWRVN